MESNQPPLFEFGIDTASRTHLSEAARWAKFLAVFGLIVCGLVAIAGVFVGAIFSSMSTNYDSGYDGARAFGSGFRLLMIVLYIGIAILYFFPCLFLLRFANHMRNALATNDQVTLNNSFQNLKIMFRYMGILTIVVISFYILAFFLGVLSAASGF